jgi:hypothetical protein
MSRKQTVSALSSPPMAAPSEGPHELHRLRPTNPPDRERRRPDIDLPGLDANPERPIGQALSAAAAHKHRAALMVIGLGNIKRRRELGQPPRPPMRRKAPRNIEATVEAGVRPVPSC